jgi:general nucleoside transport system permease protein
MSQVVIHAEEVHPAGDPSDGAPAPLPASRGQLWVRIGWGFGVPVVAILVALLAGAIVIAFEGHDPLAVYESMVDGVVSSRFGWRDTLVRASPLVLIALGLSFAFRARVYNIGAEGQLVVGATAAVAWATVGPMQNLPGPLLIVTTALVGAAAGAAWAGLAAWFGNRFGASIVICSLLLVYVGQSLLQWAVRQPLKDPDTVLPQSRVLGDAMVPMIGDLRLHAGVLVAGVLAPIAMIVLFRTRFGFRVRAMGFNRDALEANEIAGARITTAVMLVSGGLAGLAGYLEVAGVQTRLQGGISPGYGFTAITVALVGRLHPLGVIGSGVLLSAMLIGAETAQREFALPVALVAMIQSLVVLLVVAGDALADRWRADA